MVSSLAKTVDEQPVAESPIANGEGILAQLIHDGQDDACPGEDHIGPFRLQSNDFAPCFDSL